MASTRIYSDEMLYIEDPRELYKHWPAGLWQSVEKHEVKPGMNELQADFAIGWGGRSRRTIRRGRRCTTPTGAVHDDYLSRRESGANQARQDWLERRSDIGAGWHPRLRDQGFGPRGSGGRETGPRFSLRITSFWRARLPALVSSPWMTPSFLGVK